MMTNEIPSNIGEYLKYDETSPSGLRWIQKPCKNIIIGDHAGRLNKRTNYYRTQFDEKNYLNHRIIFFLHNGYCPACIDHVDGNTQNNRIDNLREATISQNSCNRKIHSNNTSGHKGVSLHSTGKYWYVRIKKDKTIIDKIFPLSEFQAACDFADEQRKILHGDFSRI